MRGAVPCENALCENLAGDRKEGTMTLPDDTDDGALPDFTEPAPGAPTLSPPSEASRSRTKALILTVIGASIALIAVIALVLSQTLFKQPGDGEQWAAPPSGTATGQKEYVPDPNDPDLAPPPPIFTQAPSAECSVLPQYSESQQPQGKVRGGGLQYTLPRTWDFPWGNGNLSYMADVAGYARNVEGAWFSVVNVGRVAWPENEGAYPGSEQAAVTIFQCYATSAGLIEYFGETPVVTDYRTEATTVDGTPAWIVQATYHFERAELTTTDQSIVTSIVVETPGGPSALVSDVAADHPDHVQELQDIIASLEVVS